MQQQQQKQYNYDMIDSCDVACSNLTRRDCVSTIYLTGCTVIGSPTEHTTAYSFPSAGVTLTLFRDQRDKVKDTSV